MQGIPEVVAALDDLRVLPRKKVNSALRKIARPIIRNARRNLVSSGNVKTGRLKKSIKALVALKKYSGLIVGPTYAGKDDASAPHAHLLEFGTKQRKLKRPVLVNFSGTWALVKETGKMKAQPFMAPAIKQSASEMERLAEKHLVPLVIDQWRYK